jgi:hypothetical protein
VGRTPRSGIGENDLSSRKTLPYQSWQGKDWFDNNKFFQYQNKRMKRAAMNMKIKSFQSIAALAVMAAASFNWTSSAKDSPQLADVEQSLSGIATPELPVSAANLVSQSKAGEQESVTMLVLQTVSEINPASIPTVVGAIGHSTPAMASVAAANAVTLQPKQTVLITRAAVGAAPDHAGEIVSAILGKLPAQYAVVAATAAEVAPARGQDILNAVMGAVPSLKPYIEKAGATTATASGNVPVLTILNQSAIMARRDQTDTMPVAFSTPAPLVVASASSVSSPASVSTSSSTSTSVSTPAPVVKRYIQPLVTIGPPPVPLTAAPVEIDPTNTVAQTPGGRNYSSP